MINKMTMPSYKVERIRMGDLKTLLLYNNLDYQKGDIIMISESDMNGGIQVESVITHVSTQVEGLKKGYCVVCIRVEKYQ